METLFKPIPLIFNNPCGLTQSANCLSVAGGDINLDAQVYLLYEIPTSLLARRFNYDQSENYLKIMVSSYFFFFVTLPFYITLWHAKNRQKATRNN